MVKYYLIQLDIILNGTIHNLNMILIQTVVSAIAGVITSNLIRYTTLQSKVNNIRA